MQAFEEAVACVPSVMRKELLSLPASVREDCFEVRLRADRPVVLFGAFGSGVVKRDGTLARQGTRDSLICSAPLLEETFHRCCEYSVYAHAHDLLRGFLTVNGNRVGVVGTAVCSAQGELTAVRDVCSLNLRVARRVPGCARGLLPLFQSTDTQSVLLAGPPASGKTTLLRDLIVSLSSLEGGEGQKLCVIDPRLELGVEDPALNCDFYRGYPMELAIENAVKTMSPQLIVCDEVATRQEIDAICFGVNCGVRFLVTVHAASRKELLRRPQVQKLLATHAFDRVALLGAHSPGTVTDILAGKMLFDA